MASFRASFPSRPVPERVLDLFTEFRNHTNGTPTGNGAGLLGALAFYGLDGIGTVEKDASPSVASFSSLRYGYFVTPAWRASRW